MNYDENDLKGRWYTCHMYVVTSVHSIQLFLGRPFIYSESNWNECFFCLYLIFFVKEICEDFLGCWICDGMNNAVAGLIILVGAPSQELGIAYQQPPSYRCRKNPRLKLKELEWASVEERRCLKLNSEH